MSKTAEQLNATVIDMRFVKPLDTEMLEEIAASHPILVSIEDHAIAGGAGSAVAEYLMSQQHSAKLLKIGLPDQFIMQGTQEEMYAELEMDTAGICHQVKKFIG